MTKRSAPKTRTLTPAELSVAIGGYTLAPSYTLGLSDATLANLTKAATPTANNEISNVK